MPTHPGLWTLVRTCVLGANVCLLSWNDCHGEFSQMQDHSSENKEHNEDTHYVHSNSIPHRDVKPVNLSYLQKSSMPLWNSGSLPRKWWAIISIHFLPLLWLQRNMTKACCDHGFSNVVMFISILTHLWPHPLSWCEDALNFPTVRGQRNQRKSRCSSGTCWKWSSLKEWPSQGWWTTPGSCNW